jgi:hypothetical protein
MSVVLTAIPQFLATHSKSCASHSGENFLVSGERATPRLNDFFLDNLFARATILFWII